MTTQDIFNIRSKRKNPISPILAPVLEFKCKVKAHYLQEVYIGKGEGHRQLLVPVVITSAERSPGGQELATIRNRGSRKQYRVQCSRLRLV